MTMSFWLENNEQLKCSSINFSTKLTYVVVLEKGHPPSSDLRYGEEDSISPAIKG